jgi:hypothetical protein
MATHEANVRRRAFQDRDTKQAVTELRELFGVPEQPPVVHLGRDPEHRAANERDRFIAELQSILPVARAKMAELEACQTAQENNGNAS